MNKKDGKKAEKWILWGIPSLFLGGSILHFAYGLHGKRHIVGMFAPVNESIWEHTKLAYIPTVIWWVGYWLKNRKKLTSEPFLSGGLTAVTASIFTVPLLYYFYTGAFGFKSLWIDISLLFLAISTGQLSGLHVFRRAKRGVPIYIAAICLGLLWLLYCIFTFSPPHLPIFCDPSTKNYGIG